MRQQRGFVPALGHGPRAFSRPGGSAAKAAGFTLIEVIVAFAILALGLTFLLGTLSGASRQLRDAGDAGRAALHVQSLLDERAALPLQPGRRDGVFEQGRYRWRMDVAPWLDPAAGRRTDPGSARLLRVQVDVEWGEAGPRQRLRVSTLRLGTARDGSGT